MGYQYTVARRPEHLAQIHALNHRTFADEIPQHRPTADGALVDRFDGENTYLVALDGDTVVGMMAMRGRRPFSLDAKLADLDAHLPSGRPVVEIRLLAVVSERRHGRAFYGLMAFAVRWMVREGYQLAVISGTTRQLGLYHRLGFRPFGPRVGPPEAEYQPMFTTIADTVRHLSTALPPSAEEGVSLLPGPVAMSPAVRAAFAQPPISHRGAAFGALADRVLDRLRALLQAPAVALLMGPGTLANDAVGAHLAAWGAPGLVLSNGAFGERLADHARRFELPHDVHRVPWGHAFDLAALADVVRECSPQWVWVAHGETSTGTLNDLGGLVALCAAHGARLCLDAVSTVGAVPVDLRGVAMASGVSGKALGAPAGLAFVSYDALPPATRPLPRALDLAYAVAQGGVPFTVSSPLVAALDAALGEAGSERMARLQRQGRMVRKRLCAAGFAPVGPAAGTLPTIQTVAMADPAEAWAVGERLDALGVHVSYRSGYLRERGWLQLCTMGALSDVQLAAATEAFVAAVAVVREGG